MFDNSMTAAMFANKGTQAGAESRTQPQMDQEPAWKSEFRQTLAEIMDKGFGDYAEEIQVKKMEELREKILASMGLSETDLENMPPDQRMRIEKMVALEMQKRVAAEAALENDDPATAFTPEGLSAQNRATPNGLSTGVLLMQAMDAEAETTAHKDDETG